MDMGSIFLKYGFKMSFLLFTTTKTEVEDFFVDFFIYRLRMFSGLKFVKKTFTPDL